MYATMTASRVTLLRVVIMALTLIGSQCEGGSGIMRWKLCGNRLSDIAITICKSRGGIYEPRERRSGPLERAVGGYERRIRRSEDGIVEECCRKACTFNQILQYCAQPPQKEEQITEDIGDLLNIARSPVGTISGDEERSLTTARPPRVGTYRRPMSEHIVFLDGEDN
ncbi:insulin growth factor II-2 [Tropilaelaps mercedesae]|uniref:Insulin growth factor II-2 n=1 Tax=Tropilaelaps mercedesae TaxID=418985 RepID=A0A1V9Y3V8_9ACAR|nr:insulin growth factor II-2 [Tropilaelaps mercedesae]